MGAEIASEYKVLVSLKHQALVSRSHVQERVRTRLGRFFFSRITGSMTHIVESSE
jgi:hypothetical protein